MIFRDIRSKRKRRLLHSITIIALIVIIIGFSYTIFLYTEIRTKKSILSTEGFIPLKVEKVINFGNYSLVQLKDNSSELVFYVSTWQASSIAEGLGNTTPFRPSTHDILKDIIRGYEIKPVMMKITRLSNKTYFGELILQKNNRFLILDIRPSDGIAIAVRTNIPIYVNETLVSKIS